MPSESKPMFWTGWVLTILPSAMLLMSGVMKILQPPAVVEGFPKLQWDLSMAIPLAIVEIGCTVVYLIPHSAVLGAILLTGYFGGAIATHVRLSEAFYIPLGLGVVIWLGLFLRDGRLRALLPFRS